VRDRISALRHNRAAHMLRVQKLIVLVNYANAASLTDRPQRPHRVLWAGRGTEEDRMSRRDFLAIADEVIG
jgi:hypothetical protein